MSECQILECQLSYKEPLCVNLERKLILLMFITEKAFSKRHVDRNMHTTIEERVVNLGNFGKRC